MIHLYPYKVFYIGEYYLGGKKKELVRFCYIKDDKKILLDTRYDDDIKNPHFDPMKLSEYSFTNLFGSNDVGFIEVNIEHSSQTTRILCDEKHIKMADEEFRKVVSGGIIIENEETFISKSINSGTPYYYAKSVLDNSHYYHKEQFSGEIDFNDEESIYIKFGIKPLSNHRDDIIDNLL